ncbi:MAG: hypothetical protein R6V01_02205 [Thermoplasmatota archaeon]
MGKRFKIAWAISTILALYTGISLGIAAPWGIRSDMDMPVGVYINAQCSIGVLIAGIPLVFLVSVMVHRKRSINENEENRKAGHLKCSECGYPLFPVSKERPLTVRCQRCGHAHLLEDKNYLDLKIERKEPEPRRIRLGCPRCSYGFDLIRHGEKVAKCPRCGFEMVVPRKVMGSYTFDLQLGIDGEMEYAIEDEGSYHERVEYGSAGPGTVYVKEIICPYCSQRMTLNYSGQSNASCENCGEYVKFLDRKALIFMRG